MESNLEMDIQQRGVRGQGKKKKRKENGNNPPQKETAYIFLSKTVLPVKVKGD